MNRRSLLINSAAQNWRLETLQVETLDKDPREDYLVLSGEALCQYLLRRDHDALVITRGPMPFISGNKASVGYVSPVMAEYYVRSMIAANDLVLWQNHGFNLQLKGKPRTLSSFSSLKV